MKKAGFEVLLELAYKGRLKTDIYYWGFSKLCTDGISWRIRDGQVIIYLHSMFCTSRRFHRHGDICVGFGFVTFNNVSLELLNKQQWSYLHAALRSSDSSSL